MEILLTTSPKSRARCTSQAGGCRRRRHGAGIRADANRAPGSRGQDRVTRATDGNLRLLVGTMTKLAGLQRTITPAPVIEVEDAPRLGRELRISREDPTPPGPGTHRILVEPPPDRDPADVGGDPRRQHLTPKLRATEARQPQPQLGGQLGRESLHFSDDPRGKKLAAGLSANDPRVRRGVLGRSVFATCSPQGEACRDARRSPFLRDPRRRAARS